MTNKRGGSETYTTGRTMNIFTALSGSIAFGFGDSN